MEVRAAVHSHYTVIFSLHSILLSIIVQLSATVNVRGFNTKWGTLTFFEATRTLSWSPQGVTRSTLTLSNWVYLKILSEDVEVRIKCFGTMLTVTGEIWEQQSDFPLLSCSQNSSYRGKRSRHKSDCPVESFVRWSFGLRRSVKYWIHFVIVWVYEAHILHWFLSGVDRIYIYIDSCSFPFQIEVSYRNQRVKSLPLITLLIHMTGIRE